jgi:hypothetical protein
MKQWAKMAELPGLMAELTRIQPKTQEVFEKESLRQSVRTHRLP